MMRQRLFSLMLMMAGFLGTPLCAQVSMDTLTEPAWWVDQFAGSGIKVRNVRMHGASCAAGWFENAAAAPHFARGILLSTGDVTQAIKPNENPKCGRVNGTAGDRHVTFIGDNRSFDAVSLEFEFVAQYDSISMRFFFASEEYNEFVGNTFNDAFAIIVTGPGLGYGENLGVIPGTQTPVTVNSVNFNQNKQYYVDNNPFNLTGKPLPERRSQLDQRVLKNCQFDGMTTPFAVGLRVKPREVYRMKIVITDVGDALLDSGLFLEGGSFRSTEQAWRVRRREEMAAQARADSIRMADSLMALASDARADSVRIADSLAHVQAAHAQQVQHSQPSALPQDYRHAPGAADTLEYKMIIEFPEGEVSPSTESEAELQRLARHLAAHPHLQAGLYPRATASEGSRMADLREKTVRYYLEQEGVTGKRVFRNGFTFLNPGEKASPTRVEVWIRPAGE